MLVVKHYKAGSVAKDHITGNWCHSPSEVRRQVAWWTAQLPTLTYSKRDVRAVKLENEGEDDDLVCVCWVDDHNELGEISP